MSFGRTPGPSGASRASCRALRPLQLERRPQTIVDRKLVLLQVGVERLRVELAAGHSPSAGEPLGGLEDTVWYGDGGLHHKQYNLRYTELLGPRGRHTADELLK
jgi:hypothetical protein